MTYAKTILASASILLVSQSAHAKVVINELLHVSGGAADYVELYNEGEDDVDISGWKLETGTKPDSYGVKATVPAGTTLAAGSYWLFTKTAAPVDEDAGADAGVSGQTMSAALPAASTGCDGARIKDSENTVVDTVLFGGANSEGFLDDGSDGGVSSSIAPKWSGTRSIGRRPNGADSDKSGTDFILTPDGQNTPGAANYEAPPVPDAGPSSSSSSGNTTSSSSGGKSSSSSSGGKSSSSGGKSSSSSSGKAASSGGKNPEGDDDDDNSGLASDGGGCNASPATPLSMLLGLVAVFAMRRRKSQK